ncbi:hypothetical protein Tco_1182034 [Tanacetum coccineum]
MSLEVVVVHVLKEEEFAKIIVLGEHVSFPNGAALSFVLRQVPTAFPVGIHQRPTEVKILPIGFHVRPDLGGVVFTYTAEVLFEENFFHLEIHLSGFLDSLLFSTQTTCLESKKELEFLECSALGTTVIVTQLLLDAV